MTKTKDQQAQEYGVTRLQERVSKRVVSPREYINRALFYFDDMEQAYLDGYTACEQSMWCSVEDELPKDDEKTHDIATKILQCMENGISVGQFFDALTWSQSVILSQTTYKGIREIASEIREKIIANATFIKKSNERKEAIDRLSVAFGVCRDAIKRQAEAIRQISEDVEKYSKALRTFKVLAKSLPRQDRKSYVSPYAKFDKIRRKRK